MLEAAIPGATSHPYVEYVHDFKGFFADHIYDIVEGINDARSFIIKERDDGSEKRYMYTPAHSLSLLSSKICIGRSFIYSRSFIMKDMYRSGYQNCSSGTLPFSSEK
eukprot:3836973-Pleurochrysis_carterae.AAC.1